jgi:hypothetical protein
MLFNSSRSNGHEDIMPLTTRLDAWLHYTNDQHTLRVDAVTINMLTIEIVCCHQQLQTELRWEVHVRNVLRISVFLMVVEVFAHFLQHNAAISGQPDLL